MCEINGERSDNPETAVVDEIARLVDAQLAAGEATDDEIAVRWAFGVETPQKVENALIQKLRQSPVGSRGDRHQERERDSQRLVVAADDDCAAEPDPFKSVDGKPTMPGLVFNESELSRIEVAFKAKPFLVDEISALRTPATVYGLWLERLGLPDLAERARLELAETTRAGDEFLELCEQMNRSGRTSR